MNREAGVRRRNVGIVPIFLAIAIFSWKPPLYHGIISLRFALFHETGAVYGISQYGRVMFFTAFHENARFLAIKILSAVYARFNPFIYIMARKRLLSVNP